MAGVIGTWGHERGLTFYEVDLGGHELPRSAYDSHSNITGDVCYFELTCIQVRTGTEFPRHGTSAGPHLLVR